MHTHLNRLGTALKPAAAFTRDVAILAAPAAAGAAATAAVAAAGPEVAAAVLVGFAVITVAGHVHQMLNDNDMVEVA